MTRKEEAGRSAAKRRIREFDIAKGIGILCVVIGHRLGAEGYSTPVIASFHMPLFFILSGLVLKPDREFTWRGSIRAERKLIADYVFWSAVFLVYDIAVRLCIQGVYDFDSVVSNVYVTLVLSGVSVLWFLSTLAISKILAKWVIAHTKSAAGRFVTGTLLYLVLTFVTYRYTAMLGEIHGITRIIYYPSLTILRALAMAGLVLCGYALKSTVHSLLHKKWGGCLALALLVNVIIAPRIGTYGYRSLLIDPGVIACLLAWTGFFGVLGLSMLIARMRIIRKGFTYFGRHSLFIMVTHEHLPLGAAVAAALAPLFTRQPAAVYLVVQIVVLMALEVMLCRWVEPVCNRAVGWMADVTDRLRS